MSKEANLSEELLEMSEPTIVETDVISAPDIRALITKLNKNIEKDECQPQGQPFYNPQTNEWSIFVVWFDEGEE